LHCNSTVENANGNTAKGIEIYYYEEPAKAFGQALLTQMTAQTGRSARGVGNAAFRVTLNSLTPSVLVEMGFMTNPVEYDSLCSRQGIYQMANAVGDGIKNFLL
ncbi:MAG: N-acetylmuramoyl-L-alanine amidase, partial [Oscillospiraceae bacterium]